MDVRGDAATQEGFNGPYQAARYAGHMGDAGEFTGQGAMQAFGPKQNEFWISIDPSLSPSGKVDVLGHEIGHIIKLTAFRNASPETQKAVVDAHAKYEAASKGLPLQDVIKMTRLAFTE